MRDDQLKIQPWLLVRVALGLGLMLASVGSAWAQDDWEAVQPPSNSSAVTSTRDGDSSPLRSDTLIDGAACGERARPAAPQIRAIVARINDLWGTDFPVYETMAPEGPHAAPGGCVFYNREALGSLMSERMLVQNQQTAAPLLWAIFAHEIGHQMHHDFAVSRSRVLNETKELEADRFAGFTLQQLNIPVTDLTPFWNMIGDEFGAGHYSHGSSAMRTEAFKQGWHLAEWNRPEDSEPVRAASDAPVAPEDSAAAPQ